MEQLKSKKDHQLEIERARQKFISSGRRIDRVAPQPEDPAQGAKPRKQRMKMLA